MTRAAFPALVLVAVSLFVSPLLAQSRTGEMRGAWMGSGYGRAWPAIMKSLKDNGFNAIFPNFCTGGAAFYPSKVLPVAAGATPGRDELAEAVKAAKQYGIELHVWRINWMLEKTPPEVLKQYEAEGRLMRNAQGKLVREDAGDSPKIDWLCPSNPINRKQEKEAMLELVRKYDIAGLEFDYMRFPSPDYCYCDHCKEQFQKDTRSKVEAWPADVVRGGKMAKQYEEWRQSLQTSLVGEISKEARKLRPGVAISLAGWPDLEVARHYVLQDWPTWVTQGSLDFLSLMTYTTDPGQLPKWLTPDLALVRGSIPVYAGLGAFMLKSGAELAQQVRASREAGADGFIAFAYGSGDLENWLPTLHASVTSADPGPMPHAGPPASLSLGGPAVFTPPAPGKVKGGAKLSVEMKVGVIRDTSEDYSAEGAAEVADLLRRSTSSQSPIDTYGAGATGTGVSDLYHLSGQTVVETPSGDLLSRLGLFDGTQGFAGSFSCQAPSGPFRVAIYGTETTSDGKAKDFVVRSPLLEGVAEAPKPQALAGEQMHAKLASIIGEFVKQAQPSELGDLDAVVQLHVTGEGGGDWWVRVKAGKGETGEGPVTQPNLTVTAAGEDVLALARGETTPYALWQARRIDAAGDVLLMGKLFPLLAHLTPG